MVPSCTYRHAWYPAVHTDTHGTQLYIHQGKTMKNKQRKVQHWMSRLSNMNCTVSWVLESHYSSRLDEDRWLVMCRYVTSRRTAWSICYQWRCSLHIQTTDRQRTNSSCHSKLLSVDSNILKLCDTHLRQKQII